MDGKGRTRPECHIPFSFLASSGVSFVCVCAAFDIISVIDSISSLVFGFVKYAYINFAKLCILEDVMASGLLPLYVHLSYGVRVDASSFACGQVCSHVRARSWRGAALATRG